MSKLVVKVQLFKGEVKYNEKGEIASESDTVKLQHGTSEWKNLMSNILAFGYTSGKVLSVIDVENKELVHARIELEKARKIPSTPSKTIDEWMEKIIKLEGVEPKKVDIEPFQKEVNGFFGATKSDTKSGVTVEQLQKQNQDKDVVIEEMMKRLEALEGKSNDEPKKEDAPAAQVEITPENGSDDAELEALRARFEELKGQKPHHKLGADKLREAIEAAEKQPEAK